MGIATYGCGLKDDRDPGSLCGLVSGFGGIAANITKFCASDAGGRSTVLDVFSGSEPTCSPQCGTVIQQYLSQMGCCSDEVLFDAFYQAASQPLITKVRPPTDLYKERIASSCGFGGSLPAFQFPARCGASNPEAKVVLAVDLFNARADYLPRNNTELASFAGRVCVETTRYAGAPLDACQLISGPEPAPGRANTTRVHLTLGLENRQAAQSAASLLTSSPVGLTSACRYLMRRSPDSVHVPGVEVQAQFVLV